eukprot:6231169-Amphidinium_carterae.1
MGDLRARIPLKELSTDASAWLSDMTAQLSQASNNYPQYAFLLCCPECAEAGSWPGEDSWVAYE